ncbi:AAA family ATPase [Salinibacterium sp. GXW1014]|uniref:AAA family ATPase n=1 Tax=Salinibacterium sp. GXW1014 TaxID=3377838 RepID=UPI003839FF94
MLPSRIVELRLNAFKSFHKAVLPLGGVTILTGRNSSGKSNALDGLEVLARLAEGEDLADALDGRRREGGAVRGGSDGCAPHGTNEFSLGCTVAHGDNVFRYDVVVEVRPDLRIVSETLYGPGVAVSSGNVTNGPLLESRPPGAPGTGIEAEVHNGKRGVNPVHRFRDSRLLISQVPLALAGADAAELSVLEGTDSVLLALRGVFHFDPVPHLMRDFVPGRDVELRRTGENLSSALRNLQRTDEEAFAHLTTLVRQIADDRVEGISFVSSDLGDVMLALNESRGLPTDALERTPARQMSDGLLRFLGIATALLSSQHGLDIDKALVSSSSAARDPEGAVLIVLEELENGLHPSQAKRVLDLVRSSSDRSGTSVLLTTHSPALLDAAEGVLNENVMVCHRDSDTGRSRLSPLTELPGYATALAEGTLGSAITSGKLVDATEQGTDFAEFERLLGLR